MIFSLLKIHTQHSKKPSPNGGGFLFPFFFPTNRLGGIAARHAAASQRGYSLSEENTPFESPRERRGESPSTPALAVGRLKDCLRCAIRCLLSDVSIRFELLLSSLPLCLRFGSLMQFPPTSDVISPASACQGAALLRSPRFWDTKNRPRQRSVLFLRQIFQSIVNALVDKFASAHIEFCGGCVNLCQLIRRNTNRDGLFCILLWDEISHDNHLLQYSML